MEYIDPIFLEGDHLISALVQIIQTAEKRLILISPYIDLGHRIKAELTHKKGNPRLHITVLFGKNPTDPSKSINKDSLEFLKEFPNIEIYYEPRLHVKYYQNDFDLIITSLNLYNYSAVENIEFGVKYNFAKKSLLGKLDDQIVNSYDATLNTLKSTIIGNSKSNIDPREAMQKIINGSTLIYKTAPKFVEKKGMPNYFAKKEMNGFTVVNSTIDEIFSSSIKSSKSVHETNLTTSGIHSTKETQFQSASALSKRLGISIQSFNSFMQGKGLIVGDNITEKGKILGIIKKNFKGKDYIAYPEDLDVLNEL